jgi:hypothetical protein
VHCASICCVQTKVLPLTWYAVTCHPLVSCLACRRPLKTRHRMAQSALSIHLCTFTSLTSAISQPHTSYSVPHTPASTDHHA